MSGDESAHWTRPSLLVRIRDAGDADAWRTFVTIYAPLVYRFARRHGLQNADAEDLTQEVMGKVGRAILSFEYQPEKGRFRDWLLTITRQRVAQFYDVRARRPEKPFDSDDLERLVSGGDRPDADWNEAFNARVLRVALDRVRCHFEPLTWRAFESVWLEDRSAAKTADEFSVDIDFVYYAKSRVLKRLREEVQEIAEDFSGLDAFEAS